MNKHLRILALSPFIIGVAIFVGVIFAGSMKAQNSSAPPQEKEKPREKPKAEDKLKGESKALPQPADTFSFDGEITGGKDNLIIVTDAQQAEHNLTVTSETKVTRGGKKATSADLKMNDNVRVQVKRTGDGTLVALSLDIAGE
jgi:hypothetical protein